MHGAGLANLLLTVRSSARSTKPQSLGFIVGTVLAMGALLLWGAL